MIIDGVKKIVPKPMFKIHKDLNCNGYLRPSDQLIKTSYFRGKSKLGKTMTLLP